MKRSISFTRLALVFCAVMLALVGLAAQMAVLSDLPTLSASLPGRGVLTRLSSAAQVTGLDSIWEQMSARVPAALAAPSPEAEVQAAWQRVRESGAYRFTADIRQTTVPRPTISNMGRQAKQDTLHLEGETDLPSRQLHLTLWSQGGSVLDATSGVEIKVEGDRAYGRTPSPSPRVWERGRGPGGGGEGWQEISNFTGVFAPQGDFMAFLAAAKDVRISDCRFAIADFSSDPQSKIESQKSKIACYAFQIDGRSYAAYARDQLERYLTEKGELPPGVSLDLSQTFVDMAGQGELWVGADGLPVRQALHLQFPPVKDEQEVRADVTVDFGSFGRVRTTFRNADFGLGSASPASKSATSNFQSLISNPLIPV